MQKIILISFFLLSLYSSCSVMPKRGLSSTSSSLSYDLFYKKLAGLNYEQRLGLFYEDHKRPLKGCVLYLQGLGDSILNHSPYFQKLSQAGYRVLSFDYLGQGDSQGNMSFTRINSYGSPFPKPRKYEIGTQARGAWSLLSSKKDPINSRNCLGKKKFVIGWSTGGLATYKLAKENWADAYILIAPGIVPRLCVGETRGACLSNLRLKNVITERTLTNNKFISEENPHIDPIKPTTPMNALEFSLNLISESHHSRYWKIPKERKGIVFLSGKNDSYIDRDKIEAILKRNAPSFTIVSYPEALHEIDNEIPSISNDLHQKTIHFFNSFSTQ